MMKIKNINWVLLCLCILLCYQTELSAETTYLAQRERAISETIEELTKMQWMAPASAARLEYMQAEAFYLYSQGMFQDALSTWRQILSLDRNNKTALYYIKETQAKIEARDKPRKQKIEERRGIQSMREKLLGPIRGQYSHTKASYNEIAPHFVMGENRYFDHSLSLIRNEQKYAIRTKRETTSFAENIRVNSSFRDYNSSFIASWSYDHSPRDDIRFPRYINFLLENDNWRFFVGDNSAYLSRYVLNGMNYRGISFMFNTSETAYPVNRFKFLYGLGKSFDTQNEEYFYPIEVFGLRDEVEFTPRYKAGVSFAYQVHEDKMTRVDSLFRPRRNIVGSFDQYIKPADWWVIRHELAYARLDNETMNITIKEEVPDVEDWAHYLSSNVLKEKWQLYNSYEYGGPNFHSLTGEARFLHNWVLTDREIFENTFIYTPIDELLFELQYHRTRNNVHGEERKETSKENYFTGLVRIRPKNWMPAIGFRTSLLRTRSIPGSDDITDKRYARDFIIELIKRLYGVDWNLAYTYQKSVEDLNNRFSDFYRNIYSIRADTSFMDDRIFLNAFYSFADLDILVPVGDITSSAHENKFDTSISSRLWGSSNISLGYHYFNRRDYIGTFENLDSHTGSIVFTWPFTKEFLNKHKLTTTPYLSYYYVNNDDFVDNRRSYFATRLDADYYFNPEQKLGLMFEYKNGIDGSNLNQEGDEIRLMTTYSSAFDF